MPSWIPTAWWTSRCTSSEDHEAAATTCTSTCRSPPRPASGPMNSVIATTKSRVPGDQAHLSRRADQRRHFRAAEHRRARGHVPLRALSAPGLGLRGRGQPAHRRGGVQRAQRGDSRPAVRRARRAPRATSRSAATIPSAIAPMSCTCSPAAATAAVRAATAVNGCSTIGISKTPPIEVMEQYYPVLFEEFSLHEGSGGAGEHRGGFGVNYTIRLRRGQARASMVMDHGRTGPLGALGGADGGVNKVRIIRRREYLPAAPVQGPGHRDHAGRPHPRLDPRRRRLRRPAAARGRGAARRGARLLHRGTGRELWGGARERLSAAGPRIEAVAALSEASRLRHTGLGDHDYHRCAAGRVARSSVLRAGRNSPPAVMAAQ